MSVGVSSPLCRWVGAARISDCVDAAGGGLWWLMMRGGVMVLTAMTPVVTADTRRGVSPGSARGCSGGWLFSSVDGLGLPVRTTVVRAGLCAGQALRRRRG